MNKDANTPVFLNHRAILGAVARKYLIHKEDVEDALQELFIRARENRKTDTTPQQKRAFLFASLRNICVDLLRKRKYRGVFIDDCPAPATEACDNHCNPVETTDIADAVRREALVHLSGLPLKVFELYTFEELDYEEIADRLGLTPEAVRTHLCRARKIMRIQCAAILKS